MARRGIKPRYTRTPNCQFHSMGWLRPDPVLWIWLLADGWKDTVKYGWVCPACLAGRSPSSREPGTTHDHGSHLRRLKERDHSKIERDLSAAPDSEFTPPGA